MAIPLKDRVQQAIDAGYTVGQLAKAAGKNSQAVSHWKSGATLTIKADSALGLARLTGWSADWWVTGKGPREDKAPQRPPMDERTAQLVGAFSELDDEQRTAVYNDVIRMASENLGRKVLAEKFGVTGAVTDERVSKVLPPAPKTVKR